MGVQEPKEEKRKLEDNDEEAMKEQNEGNNEEGVRRLRKIRKGKRRRISICCPKLLIAEVIEEGERVEELTEYVMSVTEREQAQAENNFGQMISTKTKYKVQKV